MKCFLFNDKDLLFRCVLFQWVSSLQNTLSSDGCLSSELNYCSIKIKRIADVFFSWVPMLQKNHNVFKFVR